LKRSAADLKIAHISEGDGIINLNVVETDVHATAPVLRRHDVDLRALA